MRVKCVNSDMIEGFMVRGNPSKQITNVVNWIHVKIYEFFFEGGDDRQ